MVRHTLMLLRGGTGSGRTFSSLWNGGTFNDPHGNMSELYLDDFKVDIDSDWGNVTEVC
ncbi:hypothetical protein DPMN_012739 [Dreissena polymorpha]|uniref:Uncharacterized protein n=1 Tax=Dreissena polymorpha TaxID=45954 RepID=A0A9D4N7J8_DREPO|nr:hypothetical protein DPMN_012739 [Dreissena polymorpha]